MEFVKTVLGCVLATIFYGIVHDLITVRVCLEYFTVFHPDIFHTTSPTLLAFGWGVIATWWAGGMIGLLVACSARWGPWPRLAWCQISGMIFRLLLVMAACATVAGLLGFRFGRMPTDFADMVPAALDHRFLAAWWTHGMSYLTGFGGGLVLCGVVLRKRRSLWEGGAVVLR